MWSHVCLADFVQIVALFFAAPICVTINTKKPAAATVHGGDSDAANPSTTADGMLKGEPCRRRNPGCCRSSPSGAAPHHPVPQLIPALTWSLPRRNNSLGLKYKYLLVSSSSPLRFSITCTVVLLRIRSLAMGSCMLLVLCCDVFRE
jgi:hypothetical protein